MIINLGAGGASGYILTVITNSGVTVTVTKGTKTFSVTTGPDGIATFTKLAKGTWTVTATAGSTEITQTVEITADTTISITVNAIPAFTYTGDYEIVNDEDSAITASSDDWKIRFLTSGTLTFTSLNGAADGIDVFCVGGGGNGSNYGIYDTAVADVTWSAGGGGGGGYTTTARGISVIKGDEYPIVVGGSTGTSNGFGVVAEGGTTASNFNSGGADGGSGGGGGGYACGSGGSDGFDGEASGGTGQGTTTREFGEQDAALYAGGGGGGSYYTSGAGGAGGGGKGGSGTSATGTAGTANTGGGGGAGLNAIGYGGSGIVIIRNAR